MTTSRGVARNVQIDNIYKTRWVVTFWWMDGYGFCELARKEDRYARAMMVHHVNGGDVHGQFIFSRPWVHAEGDSIRKQNA